MADKLADLPPCQHTEIKRYTIQGVDTHRCVGCAQEFIESAALKAADEAAATVIDTLGAERNAAEVRKATGEDWRVAEYVHEISRWFRKPREYRWFSMLKSVDKFGIEFQVINFYRTNSETSINDAVTADLVVAYMYGLLGGINGKGSSEDA